MHSSRSALAALGLWIAACGSVAYATPSPDSSAATLPGRGASMHDVEIRYGQPANVVPAVGNPPITRWVYDGYTVYFEGDRVIHAVSNEKRAAGQ